MCQRSSAGVGVVRAWSGSAPGQELPLFLCRERRRSVRSPASWWHWAVCTAAPHCRPASWGLWAVCTATPHCSPAEAFLGCSVSQVPTDYRPPCLTQGFHSPCTSHLTPHTFLPGHLTGWGHPLPEETVDIYGAGGCWQGGRGPCHLCGRSIESRAGRTGDWEPSLTLYNGHGVVISYVIVILTYSYSDILLTFLSFDAVKEN